MKWILIVGAVTLTLPLPTYAAEQYKSHLYLFETKHPEQGQDVPSSIAVPLAGGPTCVRMSDTSVPSNDFGFGMSPQDRGPIKNETIFCEKPTPNMKSWEEGDNSYHMMDEEGMKAISQQRDEMMRGLGIEPGSGQEQQLFKSIGKAMGQVDQAKRKSMRKAMEGKNLTPEQEAYLNKSQMPSGSPGSMEISTKLKDLRKRGSQNGIPCQWFAIEMSGLTNMVTRICKAAWSTIPGGRQAQKSMHTWMDFVKSLSMGGSMKNNSFDAWKGLDGFPLITIHEDGQGNIKSEERYVGHEAGVLVAYAPPAGMQEKSMMSMGNRKSRRTQKMIPPPMQESPPSQNVTNEPVTKNITTTLAPGECGKNKKTGEIECNTGEPSNIQKNNANNTDTQNEAIKGMQEQLGNALEKFKGLGGLFGGGEN